MLSFQRVTLQSQSAALTEADSPAITERPSKVLIIVLMITLLQTLSAIRSNVASAERLSHIRTEMSVSQLLSFHWYCAQWGWLKCDWPRKYRCFTNEIAAGSIGTSGHLLPRLDR
jgi:hypothetical protein